MKSNNTIYSFFIVLALLFWNPISCFLIYGTALKSASHYNQLLYSIFFIVFAIGILFIYMIQKDIINDKYKMGIFALAFTGILFSGLVLIDRFIGLTLKNETKSVQEGLIFEPNSQARYQTLEFDYVANINSLGLRDEEVNISKGDKYRILCFGDSWTFGWGVDIKNSWPKKLESFLHKKGLAKIQVVNCGQGGQYTTTYKKYMSRAVPLLKPDLVLVGVLQCDDLAQLYENNFKIASSVQFQPSKTIYKKARELTKTFLKASFSNIVTLFSNKSSKIIDIKSTQKASVSDIMAKFDDLQKIRFYTLNDSVQKLFISGNLNPSLLTNYINFPDRQTIFNNPNNSATKFSIKEMNQDLKGMKAICQQNNCDLIIINLPIADFTGHKVIKGANDILNPYFEKNNKVDSIYHSIAMSNNLPYIQLTDCFLSLKNKTKYFFKFDGHPNENGYAEIANYIGNQLINRTNKLQIKWN